MTDIDSQASIGLRADNGQLTARIPLRGQVSGTWLDCYQRLARAHRVPARAEGDTGRAWLVVSVPGSTSPEDVTETMDSARALIAAADEAAGVPLATSQAADSVRAWWADRKLWKPISKVDVVRAGVGAEKRWILAVALGVAIALLLLLPARFSVGPSWLVPTVEGALLVSALVADLSRSRYLSTLVRPLSVALVLVLVADAAFVTTRLVVDLVEGGPETSSAADLLEVGVAVWVYTVIAFAFLYWLLDSGGPEARIWAPREYPDLAFPEQLNPQVAPPGWCPEFLDYLYLGFTNATAFSPTDVMPLARWAKLTMTIQAAASLAIGGLVIARAVNIFK